LLWLDKLTNVLVLVLLIAMMVAARLGVCRSDLVTVLRKAPFLMPLDWPIMFSFRPFPSHSTLRSLLNATDITV
jgi:hypothetical protein